MKDRGIVFNIQKFCVNDGPGIRTTVFLKGCPIHCMWCHNPESHKKEPELFYSPTKCIGCGRCVDVCSSNAHTMENGSHYYDRSKCVSCGSCTDVCPGKALEMVGMEMTVDEVISEVLRDLPFYGKVGGMTLSGGEPLQQFDFALALLKRAKKEGMHTCIETCGFVPREKIMEIAEYVDIFLYDWKLTDAELHKKYTGVYNYMIAENLHFLDALGSKIVLRCPLIPSVNDTEEHFEGIAALAEGLTNILRVEIEPYHLFGQEKYEMLGKTKSEHCFFMPEKETVEYWITQLQTKIKVPVKKA